MEKPFIVTPNDLRQQINLVAGMIGGLYNDIMASPLSSDAMKSDYAAFVKEWAAYRNSLSGVEVDKGKSIVDYMMGPMTDLVPFSDSIKLLFTASWDVVAEFLSRAEQWRDIVKRTGIQSYQTDPSKKSGGVVYGLPWWAWAGGGLFILYNLHPLKTAHSIRSLIPSSKGGKKSSK